MKKTKFSIMVNSGSVYNINGIWRRVYFTTDERFIVKYNGEIRDVTNLADRFVKD